MPQLIESGDIDFSGSDSIDFTQVSHAFDSSS